MAGMAPNSAVPPSPLPAVLGKSPRKPCRMLQPPRGACGSVFVSLSGIAGGGDGGQRHVERPIVPSLAPDRGHHAARPDAPPTSMTFGPCPGERMTLIVPHPTIRVGRAACGDSGNGRRV